MFGPRVVVCIKHRVNKYIILLIGIALIFVQPILISENGGKKGKAVPLQAWSGPEGSRKLRFPDFVTTAQGGGKVVSLRTNRLYPRKCSCYSFMLEAE